MTGPVNKLAIPDFDKALCKNEDPELWFAEDTVNPNIIDVEFARGLCRACPERVKCLVWALRYEDFGMWGGLTALERMALKSNKVWRLDHVADLIEGMNGNQRIRKPLPRGITETVTPR